MNEDATGRQDSYDKRYLVAALLILVAKGDGEISDSESEQMMALMEEHFGIPGAESLGLLRQAIDDIADDHDMDERLAGLGAPLADSEKEDIAVMLLKIVAADGQKDAEEMDKLRNVGEMIGISGEVMHHAFDRYFEETQVLPGEDE